MKSLITNFSLALTATGLALAAIPAAAADFGVPGHRVATAQPDTWSKHHGRKHRGRNHDARYANSFAYGEPVDRGTRVWEGRDGTYYCQKKDGTTGLIIGGAVGALLGREIDGGYDRTLGTILGGAAGALLGKEVAQGGTRCR
jgi:hypothetical protein